MAAQTPRDGTEMTTSNRYDTTSRICGTDHWTSFCCPHSSRSVACCLIEQLPRSGTLLYLRCPIPIHSRVCPSTNLL